ncbi:outer membrane protein OmpX [Candidatus Pantoea edessiphila]|uniref:Outer membrane protein X n=1 Tax=Candidatus Pantoea edessiphila TaxID=2044610 RepID=A0A2P5SZ17_9GAMM|nr:Ail/Lom family outer membrane beta-barrel protein [Candidatus Pantoea edessiphila]MBK4775322.1 outer membrane beta-barrel protein [Pantoea sp. Edef]PPI87542.1 outer membrane protein OmpX [Candidatus Pantoea edessiphila]
MKKYAYSFVLACIMFLYINVSHAHIAIIGGVAHGSSKKMPIDSSGVNLKYRYEHEIYPISWINSFMYTSINKFQDNFYLKSQYYSICTGPSFRLNNWSSIYGGLGLGYGKFQSRHTVVINNKFLFSNFGPSLMMGIQFNPTKNFFIDLGYEAGIMKDNNINNVVAGIGYSF